MKKLIMIIALALLSAIAIVSADYNVYVWDEEDHVWRFENTIQSPDNGWIGYGLINGTPYGIYDETYPSGSGGGQGGATGPYQGSSGGAHCHMGFMEVPCAMLLQRPSGKDPLVHTPQSVLAWIKTQEKIPQQDWRNVVLISWFKQDRAACVAFATTHANEGLHEAAIAATVAALLYQFDDASSTEHFIDTLPSEARDLANQWKSMGFVEIVTAWTTMFVEGSSWGDCCPSNLPCCHH